MTEKELLEIEDRVNNPLVVVCAYSKMMMSPSFTGNRQRLAEEINVAGWKISEYVKSLHAEQSEGHDTSLRQIIKNNITATRKYNNNY